MNVDILNTSKIFESSVRLQMLVSLSVSDLTYNQLKEICRCSDGNMVTHTRKLLSEEYIEVKKDFFNNRPRTTYSISEKGRRELKEYVQILECAISQIDEKSPSESKKEIITV